MATEAGMAKDAGTVTTAGMEKDEFFLYTELLVAEHNWEKFEAATTAFLNDGGFGALLDGAEWDLVVALRGQPFNYSANGPYSRNPSAQGGDSTSNDDEDSTSDEAAFGSLGHNAYRNHHIQSGERTRAYINIWHSPKLADLDLSRIMMRCSDSKKYMAIDKLVAREEQNFIRRVRTVELRPMNKDPETRTFQIMRRMPSDELGMHLFHSGVIRPAMEENGWHILGQFQLVTGPINTVVEIWQTRDDGDMYGGLKELPGRIKQDAIRHVLRAPPIAFRRVYECPDYFKGRDPSGVWPPPDAAKARRAAV